MFLLCIVWVDDFLGMVPLYRMSFKVYIESPIRLFFNIRADLLRLMVPGSWSGGQYSLLLVD